MKNYRYCAFAIFTVLFMTSCGSDGTDPDVSPLIPVVATMDVTGVSTAEATSGGNVISAGQAPIIERGVVWDTEIYPTIDLDPKMVSGSGTGSFSASFGGLNEGTQYHVRAYVVNAQGTFYGNDVVFTTAQPTLVLGQSYRGGIIACFLKPGDPGYSSTVKHGLIVDPTDNNYAEWSCYTLIGNTYSSFGTGQANTNTIALGCNETDTLIALVNASNYGGYTDWYVPSKEELLRIWKNWDDGFLPADLFTNGNYWTSTEVNAQKAYMIEMESGVAEAWFKYNQETICAVRAF